MVAVLGIRPGEPRPTQGQPGAGGVRGACGVAPAIVVDGEVHAADPRQTAGSRRNCWQSQARTRAGRRPSPPLRCAQDLPRSLLRRVQEPRRHALPQLPLVRLEDVSCHEDAACSKYRSELRDLALHTSPNTVAQIFLCKGLTCDAATSRHLHRLPHRAQTARPAGTRGVRGNRCQACAKWAPSSN